jgi:uncharacterized spore protein YtfJ
LPLPGARPFDDGMGLTDLATSLRDSLTVARVFGEPYERDGVTVIPAASVRGGMGGGSGKKETEEGEGGGLGLVARPAGAYVIKDGSVTWQPAVDVNRIVLTAIAGWVAVAWIVARSVGRRPGAGAARGRSRRRAG